MRCKGDSKPSTMSWKSLSETQKWDVQQLTFDEGGRHWVYSWKLRPNIVLCSCTINFFMSIVWIFGGGQQLLSFHHWPSAFASNNDAIFYKHRTIKQISALLKSTFIKLCVQYKALLMAWYVVLNTTWNCCCWIVCVESNSKCQRWIHVSNRIKKWISFHFCNVIALLCRNCVFLWFIFFFFFTLDGKLYLI